MDIVKVRKLMYSVIDGNKKRSILDNVNLDIEKGKVTVVYGPSGSGKTTLLYAISGMLNGVDAGEVVIEGNSIYSMTQKQRDEFRLQKMGLIFQNYNLFPYMNVKENIYVPIYAKNKKPDEEIEERLQEYLHIMGIQQVAEKSVSQLSGGEQQRIAIVRAFIEKPSLILCDEPTANLDSENSINFYQIVKDLAHKTNCTVLIVSHDTMAQQYCDCKINFVDGKPQV